MNSIQVATYNVLDDHYLPYTLKNLTSLRWNSIIQQVKQNPAHFWIFSEATPRFASALLEDEFIKNTYSSSDSDAEALHTLSGEAGSTSQLVLIRRDIAVQSIFFTKTHLATGKRLVFVLARFSSGIRIALSAVHLTSGQLHQSRSPAAVDKRRQQLQYILSKMDQLQNECDLHIIAGDFNFKGELDENMGGRILERFVEADDNLVEPTFDPMRNSLAALNSNQTTPMRLDRIYIRHLLKDRTIHFQKHQILGQDPISVPLGIEDISEVLPNGLHPSDHYGVISTFTVEGGEHREEQKASWSTASALAIIPDQDVQECIDTLWRAEYDPSHQKWPPHINLIYPFVNVEAIPQVCSSIRNHLTIQAFNVPASLRMEMLGIQSFRHKSSQTVYLAPANGGMRKLHEIIRQCVVQSCDMKTEYPSRRGRSDYTPHLTIAKLKGYTEEQVHEFVARAETKLSTIADQLHRCTVNSLSVLRRVNGKMIVVDKIELPNFEAHYPAQRSLELVRSLTRQVFSEASNPQVIPVGSSVLLGKSLFSDLDVVVLPPNESKDIEASGFFHKIRTILPESVRMRLVSDARCPIISLSVGRADYLPIDIIIGDGKYTDEIINDSCALQERMKSYDVARQNTAKEALIQLKLWAKAKQFTGRAFNLFPGITWPIALFCVMAENKEMKWEGWKDLLILFFEAFQEVDWKTCAIKMGGKARRDTIRFLNGRDCRDDRCIIVAPVSACNVAQFVVSSVLKSFNEESKLALASLRSESWEDAWTEYRDETVQIESLHEFGIDIIVRTPNGFDEEELSGWLKGKFASIVEKNFECKGIAIRPSTTLQWSTTTLDGVAVNQGVLHCGIDAELTEVELSCWQTCISAAEVDVRDKFLRWGERPEHSSVTVALSKRLIVYGGGVEDRPPT